MSFLRAVQLCSNRFWGICEAGMSLGSPSGFGGVRCVQFHGLAEKQALSAYLHCLQYPTCLWDHCGAHAPHVLPCTAGEKLARLMLVCVALWLALQELVKSSLGSLRVYTTLLRAYVCTCLSSQSCPVLQTVCTCLVSLPGLLLFRAYVFFFPAVLQSWLCCPRICMPPHSGRSSPLFVPWGCVHSWGLWLYAHWVTWACPPVSRVVCAGLGWYLLSASSLGAIWLRS